LDIKLKNNHRRKALIITVLLAAVIGTMAFFPGISRRGENYFTDYRTGIGKYYEESTDDASFAIDGDFILNVYKGCFVLYKETVEHEKGTVVNGSELFIEDYPTMEEWLTEEDLKAESDLYVNQIIDSWISDFEDCRSYVDYAVVNGASNTGRPLESVLADSSNSDCLAKLISYYREIFALCFDENGTMEVKVYHTASDHTKDLLIKNFGKADRSAPLEAEFREWSDAYGEALHVRKPRSFTVIFATPLSQFQSGLVLDSFSWEKFDAYENAGATLLFIVMLVLLALFALFMGNKRIWKENAMIQRPKKWYLMEAAIIAVICLPNWDYSFIQLIWNLEYYPNLSSIYDAVATNGIYIVLLPYFQCILILFSIYAAWYAGVYFIRPVFYLGIGEYIRQYSLVWQIFPWIGKKWDKFIKELGHIDFNEKSTGTILKIVFINFTILAFCSLLWFWGITVLIVYSLVVFYLLKKNYDKIRKNYQILLQGVNRIAEGDLETVIIEDLGVFEPFRNELAKIRTGFQKAVDNEVKSQRMKTELITNVSHDLKTPLTAITTYIELLKKQNITEAERRSYIETLEKKSTRLKILIEDLFEVSKAGSDNITLNLMELDVVNLMRQVSIEHTDKMQKQGMEIRWNVPNQKVMVRLDNQKTYRIFENLFSNICKYAMPNSRIYADVNVHAAIVEIILKNISAEELNISPDEITERFVRGDKSRNTEGSGLGLAIAKSFTQAQGGKFEITIDGDLFKVLIEFPLMRQEEGNIS